MSDAALTVKDLKRTFLLPGSDTPIRALNGVDLTVKKGGVVAIRGPSGSGKTTLLQLLGALDNPTSGTITVEGMEREQLTEDELTDYRARTIGFIFQTFNLIPNLNAMENVELPMEAVDMDAFTRREKAFDLLEAVGMQDRAGHRPMKLSGGERQRVAIARALANDPSIILADEPTGNLDTRTGRKIINLLKRMAKERGTTVIIVTHDDKVARVCDETYTIIDGMIKTREERADIEAVEDARETLQENLGINKKYIEKLISAGYMGLADVAAADIEGLKRILGGKNMAVRVRDRAEKVWQETVPRSGKDDADTIKELRLVLAVKRNVAEILVEEGFRKAGDVAEADPETLATALGDDVLAERMIRRAREHLEAMEDD